MNSRILLAVITIAVLSSCSTAYKAQTPDDVYYSPARPQDEYVNVEKQKDREEYRAEEEYADDRYLRWKVRNRSRWSGFDNYAYDPYDYRYYGTGYYGNNYTWYSPNYVNAYWSWNYGYNPYCGRVIIVNPKNTPAYNQVVRNYRPGTYNTTYSNNNSNNSKFKTSPGVYRSSGSYNNSNNNSSSLGSSIKKVFNNSSSNNNSSSSDRPTRTYTPPSNSSNTNSSSSGSSSSGSSNSGGGVSRPSRGGN
ncbi:MAG: hypothetical protein WCF67_10090 [Chitinophagaceae bacterium]